MLDECLLFFIYIWQRSVQKKIYSRSLFSADLLCADLHSAAFCKILIQSCIVRKIKENLKKFAQCGIFFRSLRLLRHLHSANLHSAENFAFWTLCRTKQGPTVLLHLQRLKCQSKTFYKIFDNTASFIIHLKKSLQRFHPSYEQ